MQIHNPIDVATIVNDKAIEAQQPINRDSRKHKKAKIIKETSEIREVTLPELPEQLDAKHRSFCIEPYRHISFYDDVL